LPSIAPKNRYLPHGARLRSRSATRPRGGRRIGAPVESRVPDAMYALHKRKDSLNMKTIEMMLISVFIFLTPVLLLLVVRDR
jgi:hypothetical protein